MSTNADLTPAQAIALFRRCEPYIQADKVGIVVALILIPILFLAVGGFFFFVIPMPFALYIGGSIWLAMIPILLFVLIYRRRTLTRAPTVIDGVVRRKTVVHGRYGDVALYMTVEVGAAWSLGPSGVLGVDSKLTGRTPRKLVVNGAAFDVVGEGQRALILCGPAGQIVEVFRPGEI